MSEPMKKYHWAYQPKVTPVMKISQFLPSGKGQKKVHRTRVVSHQQPHKAKSANSNINKVSVVRSQITARKRPITIKRHTRAPQRRAGAGLRMNNVILTRYRKRSQSK